MHEGQRSRKQPTGRQLPICLCSQPWFECWLIILGDYAKQQSHLWRRELSNPIRMLSWIQITDCCLSYCGTEHSKGGEQRLKH